MKIVFAAIAIFALITVQANPTCAQSIVRKSPELAFAVPGQGEQLLSHFRGKVIALEFILTTCPHCQAASKLMTGMEERYASRGFQALDVAIDPNADLLVENFAKEYHIAFPVGWTRIEQMMSYMGFASRPLVPQLVLIDRNGNIRYQTPRESDSDSMKEDVIAKRIEELLDLNSSSKIRHH